MFIKIEINAAEPVIIIIVIVISYYSYCPFFPKYSFPKLGAYITHNATRPPIVLSDFCVLLVAADVALSHYHKAEMAHRRS